MFAVPQSLFERSEGDIKGANHCVTVCHMTWKLTMFCKQDYIQCIL
jgi:hypothetical protein